MENTIEMYGGKIYGVAVSEYGLEKGYLDYRALANILEDRIMGSCICRFERESKGETK